MRWRLLVPLAVLAAAALAVGALARGEPDDTPAPTASPAPAAATPTPEPPPRASRFVAADGSDARRCRTPATACATFERAYRSAKPGEVVDVAGGRYPEQQIVADTRKNRRAQHVTFRPAAGEEVELDGLSLGSGENADGPRHLTIEDMKTTFAGEGEQHAVAALPGTRDVVWRNLDAGNFSLWGVRRFRILGGDWGPCAISAQASCTNAKIDAGPAGSSTRDVLVSGARFHDFRFSPECYTDGADCHFECMYVNGSRNVTIRDSEFRDCALYDIFVTLSGPDAARVGHRNLKIEDNRFDTPWDESGPGTAERGARQRRVAQLVPELPTRLPRRI